LAATGYLPPLVAVIGMIASSALVMLNSKRIATVEPDRTQAGVQLNPFNQRLVAS